MALFIWLGYDEYKNYISLFIAGKVIAVVSFFAWELFSFLEFAGSFQAIGSIILFGGGALLCLADTLSVWGMWAIDKKFRNKYRRNKFFRNKFRRAITPEIGGE
jgi:hypothetical protein